MSCVARRRPLVDHANVDALVEADLEAVRPDLVDARLLLLARLTEEMIVERMQMPRPWLAAPNLCNGVDRVQLALFLRHYAEATFQILFERLRQAYEYIIVDLPPLAPVVDGRAMTHLVDSFVFVIEWGRTKIGVVEHALRMAPDAYDNLLGVVLNKINLNLLGRYESHHRDYFYNRRYARYGYVQAAGHPGLAVIPPLNGGRARSHF
jgi:hypothetical protein